VSKISGKFLETDKNIKNDSSSRSTTYTASASITLLYYGAQSLQLSLAAYLVPLTGFTYIRYLL